MHLNFILYLPDVEIAFHETWPEVKKLLFLMNLQ